MPSQGRQTSAAEWSVLLYLAGDNNLSSAMIATLQTILEQELWPRVGVLAELDPSGRGRPTQRYVFDDRGSEELSDFLAEEAPEENTGNPEALVEFTEWALKARGERSLYHALILSGHASGITQDYLARDSSPYDALTIPELQTALKEIRDHLGGKLSLLGMDSCFMSMVEVAFAVRKFAEILVGAESFTPEAGWPYGRILRKATRVRKRQSEAITPERLARLIVRRYVNHYADHDHANGLSVDLAAVRLTCIEDLAEAVGELGRALMAAIKHRQLGQIYRTQLTVAHWESQTYKFDQFVDLRDLTVRILRGFADGATPSSPASKAVVAAARRVQEQIERCVILSGCSGSAYQHSYGLSIYLPWVEAFPDYFELEWAANGWGDFIESYLKENRREARPGFVPFEPVRERRIVRARAAAQQRQDKSGVPLPSFLVRQWVEAAAGEAPERRELRTRFHSKRFHGKKFADDRRESIKNFPAVTGKVFWPTDPEDPSDDST